MRGGWLSVPLLILCLGAASPKIVVSRAPGNGFAPQLAIDSRGVIRGICFHGDPKAGDVQSFSSTDDFTTATAPQQVNSEPGSAMAIGGVRGPRMAIGKDDRVCVIWTGSDAAQPKPRLAGLPLMYSTLDDKAKTWTPQRRLIESGVGIDGGASIAADRTGNVIVAWHAPSKPDGDEQSRELWLLQSKDNGQSFAPPVSTSVSYLGMCACCATENFFDAKGDFGVIYRTAHRMTQRNMMLATFDLHPLKPTSIDKLGELQIGKCVMSTSAARDGFIAWEGLDQVFIAKASDSGHPIALGTKGHNPKHPRVAANDQFVLAAWTEETAWNKGGTLHWQLLDRTLKPIANAAGTKDDLSAWSYPAVVASPSGAFVILY